MRQNRYLLILDNFQNLLKRQAALSPEDSISQVMGKAYKDFLELLGQDLGESRVLIISWETPPIGRGEPPISIPLGDLGLNDTVRLLETLGVRSSTEEARVILSKVGGNPQGLKLLGPQLNRTPLSRLAKQRQIAPAWLAQALRMLGMVWSR